MLIVFIAVMAVYHFWQSKSVTHSGAIELNLPTLVASFDGLNYGEIELAFADLQFENEHLVLDANTESQFSIALEHLPAGLQNTHLDRIKFLLQQQFDHNQGQQILSLLKKMAVYKKQETNWWEKNTAASVDNYNLLFDLQDRLLGEEVAKKLYREQRHLMRRMAATYAIERDESLSEKQKRDALKALSNALESSQQ